MPQSAIDQSEVDGNRIQASDVAQITSDLFVAMLSMPFDAKPSDDLEVSGDALEACVKITGEWTAELRVLCPTDLVSRIACTMYGTTEEDLEAEEARDALGEVANVVGGNVKGIINGECALSLPCVGQPRERDDQGLWLTFKCDDSPITIALIEN